MVDFQTNEVDSGRARFGPTTSHAYSPSSKSTNAPVGGDPPKSCLRGSGSGNASMPPPDPTAYNDLRTHRPRHNRQQSVRAHRHRHAASDMPNIPSKGRPAFVRGSTRVRDPSRPELKRQPTPFHAPGEMSEDEDIDEASDTDDKEYADVEDVVDQIAGFLNQLSDAIGPQLMRKYVSTDKIYALHQAPPMAMVAGKVFGVPVRTACAVAPCLASFAGQLQRIPYIVFAVIEEIYGRGLDVSGIFRIAGDEKRVEYLVKRFAVEPFGEGMPIEKESIPDLCGLLQTWLGGLPVPVLEPALERAFFSLVVCGEHAGLDPDARVQVAQLLLRLLPAANLSLFVYLLSFLSHFQRATKLHVGVVSGLFSKPLAAKPVRGESENAKRARRDAAEDAKEIVKWLLMNWHLVMDGLMEEPVLEVGPCEADCLEPQDDEAGLVPERASTAAAQLAELELPTGPQAPSPPPDPAYVETVKSTLDALSTHLAAMLEAMESLSDAPIDAKASEDAAKFEDNMEEGARLKERVGEMEGEKATLEKKLAAAHKALAAALGHLPE